jgi:hypothetical protein
MLDINNMKYSEVVELKKQLIDELSGEHQVSTSDTNKHFRVGGNVFVRTVTHILVGRLVDVYDSELVIDRASWIADTGRYSDSMLDFSKFDEVEPYPPEVNVVVGRGAIIDAHMTNQALPDKQK